MRFLGVLNKFLIYRNIKTVVLIVSFSILRHSYVGNNYKYIIHMVLRKQYFMTDFEQILTVCK